MCVRDHSYVCECELGTLTVSQHNIFDSEKLVFLVLLTGFKPLVMES